MSCTLYIFTYFYLVNSLGLALKLTENKFKMKYGINKPESDDCNIVFMDSSGERSDIAYKYAKEHGYQW